jgi:hypothetical protein
MKRPRLICLAVAMIACLCESARSAVFQYGVPLKTVDGKDGTAFLWVPPKADRIRGVLVGGQTLMEEQFSQDPIIRDACADEKLAIIYMAPHLDGLFDYQTKHSGELLQKVLDDLASASGYKEIAVAPLFPYGHSVGTIFASHVVYWKPDRCFGALLFKGGVYLPEGQPPTALLGVPILAIKGQFEEFGPGPSGVLRDFEDREAAWKSMRETMLKLRAQDDRYLLSLLVEPGASHFAWSSTVAPHVAAFIRQAAQQRIPDWPIDSKTPVRCRAIGPAGGALTDSQIGNPAVPAAMYAEFKGDRKRAFWHLNLDLARNSETIHQTINARKPQFVTFADPEDGKPIFVGHDLRLKLPVHWTGPDTFKVAGVFLDHPPDKYPKTDGPIGHAPGPILFRAFGGAIEQTGPDTFRVSLNGIGRLRADILAFRDGDGTYRHAEQQGRISLPEKLIRGRPQSIAFPPIGEIHQAQTPIGLTATSDAGLKVRYYVESGPAALDGDAIKLEQIPARASFPLTLKIVAYQYGSAIEPFVQTAEPVVQTVMVAK